MKKHLKQNHKPAPNYSCKECEFTSKYIADAWKHGFEVHPERETEYKPQLTQNDILKIVAEQNTVLIEEIDFLKRNIQESFSKLNGILETSIGGLKEDTDKKCKTLSEAMSKLYERMSKIGKSNKTVVKNVNFVKNAGPPRPKGTPSQSNSKPSPPSSLQGSKASTPPEVTAPTSLSFLLNLPPTVFW